MEQKLVLFESADHKIQLPVILENDTVWLNRNQMSELFDRDIKTIGKHISNALKEELDRESATVAKIATVQKEGEREVLRQIEHYSLDVIISVGYRVKSKRGIEFRRWANSVLKEYIIKGYAVNHNRMNQLNEVIRVMKRVENNLDTKQVLSVVEKYSQALDLLDAYDHQNMSRPNGNQATYVLTYEECRMLIDHMKFGSESTLFGKRRMILLKEALVRFIKVSAEMTCILHWRRKQLTYCILLRKIIALLMEINGLQRQYFCIS